MEVIKTAFIEEMNLSHKKATLYAVTALLPLGLILAFSFTPLEINILGRPFLEFMDFITANQVVVVSGLVGGAILGWSIKKYKTFKIFDIKYRHLARHTIITARYLWVFVLTILILASLY